MWHLSDAANNSLTSSPTHTIPTAKPCPVQFPGFPIVQQMDCVSFYYDAQFSTGNESNNATKKTKSKTKRKIDQFQQLID